MSNKLFCYEQGSCRGECFSSRHVLNVAPLLVLLEELNAMESGVDSEEADTLIEQSAAECSLHAPHKWSQSTPIFTIVQTGDSDLTLEEMITKIRNGERFGLVEEEGSWGFGSTPEEAKQAYMEAETSLNGCDDDDWGDEDEEE